MDDMSMIERVAKAICEASREQDGGVGPAQPVQVGALLTALFDNSEAEYAASFGAFSPPPLDAALSPASEGTEQ